MTSISTTIETYRPSLSSYEELYKYFHSHPELSFQEKETAAKIASHLRSFNAYEIFTDIGGHGLAAVLRNGEGKRILLRADIDALPVEEESDLEFKSTVRMKDLDGVAKPVMHACGHDIHITALLAAAEALANAKERWAGTLILIFQPAEERAAGAQAMVDDGLYNKVPEPDLAIGAHVMPYRAGVIGTKRGITASSADRFQLRIVGRQAHGSMPEKSIDPIVQASSTILRLQTVVSREINPAEFAVLTVSAIHAGDAENIIPSHADLKIDTRAANPQIREQILTSMRRIIDAENAASGNPNQPVLKETTKFPFLFNDDNVTAAIEDSFHRHFDAGPHTYDKDIARLSGSEDFGILATSIGKPSCFFLYGGVDPVIYDKHQKEGTLNELPVNHSPKFTPVIQPTLSVAVDGYLTAALTFLGI